MDNIIEVTNVSMKFNMYKEKIDNIKEYFIKLAQKKLYYEEFWALKDISFTLEKGDSLGLVGRNGSGKSTMMKILAGVMKPTEGSVNVYGNVAPLIELGAGFDIELTARENIYLNAAVLGFSKQETAKKFDEIVDFSEVEEFLDVPIKNFSSGMYAKLGFSVATAYIPDILIVDEILSVGDFKFQEKCKDKIDFMLKNGTTLLFVSHNSEQIQELCNKALWIDKGVAKLFGDSEMVCKAYSDS